MVAFQNQLPTVFSFSLGSIRLCQQDINGWRTSTTCRRAALCDRCLRIAKLWKYKEQRMLTCHSIDRITPKAFMQPSLTLSLHQDANYSRFNGSTTTEPIQEFPDAVEWLTHRVKTDGWPEHLAAPRKEQPWRKIWSGPTVSEDGKLIIACPKGYEWGKKVASSSPCCRTLTRGGSFRERLWARGILNRWRAVLLVFNGQRSRPSYITKSVFLERKNIFPKYLVCLCKAAVASQECLVLHFSLCSHVHPSLRESRYSLDELTARLMSNIRRLTT